MPYDRFHAAGDRDCGAQRKPATDPTQEDEEELLGGGGGCGDVPWVSVLSQVGWKTLGDNTGTWSPWPAGSRGDTQCRWTKGRGTRGQELRGAEHR